MLIIKHEQEQESHAEWPGLVRPTFQSAYKNVDRQITEYSTCMYNMRVNFSFFMNVNV